MFIGAIIYHQPENPHDCPWLILDDHCYGGEKESFTAFTDELPTTHSLSIVVHFQSSNKSLFRNHWKADECQHENMNNSPQCNHQTDINSSAKRPPDVSFSGEAIRLLLALAKPRSRPGEVPEDMEKTKFFSVSMVFFKGKKTRE